MERDDKPLDFWRAVASDKPISNLFEPFGTPYIHVFVFGGPGKANGFWLNFFNQPLQFQYHNQCTLRQSNMAMEKDNLYLQMIFPAINLHLQGDFPLPEGNYIPVKIETSERPKVERANFWVVHPGYVSQGLRDPWPHEIIWAAGSSLEHWWTCFFFWEHPKLPGSSMFAMFSKTGDFLDQPWVSNRLPHWIRWFSRRHVDTLTLEKARRPWRGTVSWVSSLEWISSPVLRTWLRLGDYDQGMIKLV